MNDAKLIEILWICVTFLSVSLGIAIFCLREKNNTVAKLKNKKKFIQTKGNTSSKSYLVNVDNISYIYYDDKNDVARIYFDNHDHWIEVDISKPLTKEDFIYSLNHTNDFLVEGDD